MDTGDCVDQLTWVVDLEPFPLSNGAAQYPDAGLHCIGSASLGCLWPSIAGYLAGGGADTYTYIPMELAIETPDISQAFQMGHTPQGGVMMRQLESLRITCSDPIHVYAPYLLEPLVMALSAAGIDTGNSSTTVASPPPASPPPPPPSPPPGAAAAGAAASIAANVSSALGGVFFSRLYMPPSLPAPRLRRLAINNCTLTGQLPPETTWLQLPALEYLDLSANQLSGPLPATLGPSPPLRHVNLSHNRIAGPLPPDWARYGGCGRTLDLSYNDLRGDLPDAWLASACLQHGKGDGVSVVFDVSNTSSGSSSGYARLLFGAGGSESSSSGRGGGGSTATIGGALRAFLRWAGGRGRSGAGGNGATGAGSVSGGGGGSSARRLLSEGDGVEYDTLYGDVVRPTTATVTTLVSYTGLGSVASARSQASSPGGSTSTSNSSVPSPPPAATTTTTSGSSSSALGSDSYAFWLSYSTSYAYGSDGCPMYGVAWSEGPAARARVSVDAGVNGASGGGGRTLEPYPFTVLLYGNPLLGTPGGGAAGYATAVTPRLFFSVRDNACTAFQPLPELLWLWGSFGGCALALAAAAALHGLLEIRRVQAKGARVAPDSPSKPPLPLPPAAAAPPAPPPLSALSSSTLSSAGQGAGAVKGGKRVVVLRADCDVGGEAEAEGKERRQGDGAEALAAMGPSSSWSDELSGSGSGDVSSGGDSTLAIKEKLRAGEQVKAFPSGFTLTPQSTVGPSSDRPASASAAAPGGGGLARIIVVAHARAVSRRAVQQLSLYGSRLAAGCGAAAHWLLYGIPWGPLCRAAVAVAVHGSAAGLTYALALPSRVSYCRNVAGCGPHLYVVPPLLSALSLGVTLFLMRATRQLAATMSRQVAAVGGAAAPPPSPPPPPPTAAAAAPLSQAAAAAAAAPQPPPAPAAAWGPAAFDGSGGGSRSYRTAFSTTVTDGTGLGTEDEVQPAPSASSSAAAVLAGPSRLSPQRTSSTAAVIGAAAQLPVQLAASTGLQVVRRTSHTSPPPALPQASQRSRSSPSAPTLAPRPRPSPPPMARLGAGASAASPRASAVPPVATSAAPSAFAMAEARLAAAAAAAELPGASSCSPRARLAASSFARVEARIAAAAAAAAAAVAAGGGGLGAGPVSPRALEVAPSPFAFPGSAALAAAAPAADLMSSAELPGQPAESPRASSVAVAPAAPAGSVAIAAGASKGGPLAEATEAPVAEVRPWGQLWHLQSRRAPSLPRPSTGLCGGGLGSCAAAADRASVGGQPGRTSRGDAMGANASGGLSVTVSFSAEAEAGAEAGGGRTSAGGSLTWLRRWLAASGPGGHTDSSVLPLGGQGACHSQPSTERQQQQQPSTSEPLASAPQLSSAASLPSAWPAQPSPPWLYAPLPTATAGSAAAPAASAPGSVQRLLPHVSAPVVLSLDPRSPSFAGSAAAATAASRHACAPALAPAPGRPLGEATEPGFSDWGGAGHGPSFGPSPRAAGGHSPSKRAGSDSRLVYGGGGGGGNLGLMPAFMSGRVGVVHEHEDGQEQEPEREDLLELLVAAPLPGDPCPQLSPPHQRQAPGAAAASASPHKPSASASELLPQQQQQQHAQQHLTYPYAASPDLGFLGPPGPAAPPAGRTLLHASSAASRASRVSRGSYSVRFRSDTPGSVDTDPRVTSTDGGSSSGDRVSGLGGDAGGALEALAPAPVVAAALAASPGRSSLSGEQAATAAAFARLRSSPFMGAGGAGAGDLSVHRSQASNGSVTVSAFTAALAANAATAANAAAADGSNRSRAGGAVNRADAGVRSESLVPRRNSAWLEEQLAALQTASAAALAAAQPSATARLPSAAAAAAVAAAAGAAGRSSPSAPLVAIANAAAAAPTGTASPGVRTSSPLDARGSVTPRSGAAAAAAAGAAGSEGVQGLRPAALLVVNDYLRDYSIGKPGSGWSLRSRRAAASAGWVLLWSAAAAPIVAALAAPAAAAIAAHSVGRAAKWLAAAAAAGWRRRRHGAGGADGGGEAAAAEGGGAPGRLGVWLASLRLDAALFLGVHTHVGAWVACIPLALFSGGLYGLGYVWGADSVPQPALFLTANAACLGGALLLLLELAADLPAWEDGVCRYPYAVTVRAAPPATATAAPAGPQSGQAQVPGSLSVSPSLAGGNAGAQ